MMKKELISYICNDVTELVKEIARKDGSDYKVVCLDVEAAPERVSVYFSGMDNKLYIYLSLDKYDNYGRLLKDVVNSLRGYFMFNKVLLYPTIDRMREQFRRMVSLDLMNYDLYNKKYIFKDMAVSYSEELVLSTELTNLYVQQQRHIKKSLLSDLNDKDFVRCIGALANMFRLIRN